MSYINGGVPSSGPGSGTVTSITFNGGLTSTPDPVTTIGTATLDQSSLTTTDGTVYWTGAKLASTTTGSAGQVLTSNGVGLAPTYQAAAGGGITTINGDTGSVTGATVSFKGNADNSTLRFSGAGTAMTFLNEDANANVIVGSGSTVAITGIGNSFFGHIPCNLSAGVTGNFNTSFGYETFATLTSGSHNAGFGQQPCIFLKTGSYNLITSAYQGGVNYTGAESSNININCSATSVTGESNVCRIGDGTGTGIQQLNATYISGIQGVGIVGTAVLVSASDQLGIAVSSRRFKENVQPLNDSKVLDLQPVSFNYKQSGDKSIGLIAEDVFELIPDLVVNDKDGLPLTVKYQDLPVYLLAEIKKLRAEVNALKGV